VAATALLPIEQDTSLVTFSIKVSGEELPLSLPVQSVSVYNEANRISVAHICINDGDVALADWSISNDTWFVPGNEIEILAGYHSTNETIFKGIITKHSLRVRERRSELNVECRDKAVLMTIGRNSNLFADVTDGDIADALLGPYTLSGTIDTTPVTHAEIIQYDCTDWDYLITRIESVGFVAIAKDGKIDITKPVLESTALATLRFGTNLIEFDAEIDGRRQYGNVKAQAWDPSAQDILEVTSNDPAWTTTGNISPSDISTAAGTDEYVLRQPGRLTEEEAQHWADAKLLRSRMAFMCGRARVEGFSKAVPGITVSLEGLGDRFNGMAWVSGVRHEISNGNWFTDLQLGLTQKLHIEKFSNQSPAAGALLPGINGLHTAVVTALEGDPDSEERIRIKIPSVAFDGDGSWARIATLDAGSSRGIVFRPEIDDEVIVGFIDDDPGQPVVLGALHSSVNASPIPGSDDNHQKGFTTRSGMRILFDDEKTIITIDTPGGNILVLDEDTGGINITDQNGNKIVMSSDGISMESAKDFIVKAKGDIKLESSMGLQAKAGTQFKAEGSAGLEISSSAITTVKGSLVQIN
jgi:Rhs element Vgr protein